ncbi:MAG: hypothetical protein O9296_07440 [Novosphingobium sp.]|jgi:hypothetical protein|nr:hypothetical protein [Novosphingobium sp.]
MSKSNSLKAVAFGLAAMLAGWSGEALANRCGLETANGGTANLVYDPFKNNATTLTVTNLVLRRINGTGGEKTMDINFYLKAQSAALDGMQVTVVSATGLGTPAGIGNQIFHNFTGPFPTPSVAVNNTAPPGTFYWNFGGNDPNSDTITLGLAFTIPGNLNIPASTTIPLDIIYACDGTGKGGNFTENGTFSGAFQAQITVLSALQASFVGTALDFQDITNVDNLAAPSRNTGTSNHVRVQSSGAYTVSLTSLNGYRLKHPAGSLTVPTERVNYELKFLGTTRNELATTPITQNCARAGVGTGASNEDRLTLVATLREGGVGKTPSPTGPYTDELTVTITPQDILTSYPTDCGLIPLP